MPQIGTAYTWIDSHCHLQLGDGEAEAAVDRAVGAGVERLICIGTDLATSQEAVDLAGSQDHVWATVGLHPHDASRHDSEWDGLCRLAGAPRVVGIGEAGFDLHYRHSPEEAQEESFRAHVRLATELDLALVIHSREAWDQTFAVLQSEGMPARTVFHCFTGGPAEARQALDLGAWLSFSGIVSFRNADDVRAAAALTPADRLLVETDSPFLAPAPHRGRPNEPAYLPAVGAAVAAARGTTPEAVAELTRHNALAVFWP
ncbi:MAG: TatD family hydrolase [Actinomycetota bacterium]|nr:TatD family hydrolase [Actinomycetota bacterium]